MEMASAHGLAQRLVEMSRYDRISRNEYCEIISEDDNIIKSWYVASSQQRFHKREFFNLTRKTLLFVLSQQCLKEVKKKELLKGVSLYFSEFSSMLKNNLDFRRPLIDVIVDPWKNVFFSWEELFQKRVTFRDLKVQEFFRVEPEEIVLARVHLFSSQGKDDMSMILAKNSFLYHSRIAKHFSHPDHKMSNSSVHISGTRKGTASMDWYLHNLRRKKSLLSIYNELKQLSCHEGVLLVLRLRQTKWISFAFTIVELFLMQELVQPSKFCCTKKLFALWCILHKEQRTSKQTISEKVNQLMALYAPSSAHFYLFVDALWEQFGTDFINLYVELYVRGLTVDLNHLEAAKNGDVHEDISYLESHIASVFYKLSTLFIDFHECTARECMFSAFSLKPTKDKLYILQSLTLSILSNENKLVSTSNSNSASLQECKCTEKCIGLCKSGKDRLEHPLLKKGVTDVTYIVLKDLVSILESVRSICFQYNTFDWHNNATDLGDYLKDFTLSKSWESDTECASEGSARSDENNSPVKESVLSVPPVKLNIDALQILTKRKNESDAKEMFSLDVGANIEVGNDEFMRKKIKIEEQNKNEANSPYKVFNSPLLAQSLCPDLGMEDAIENVIRMTLDNRQRSDPSLDNNLNLSSGFKPKSEKPVYPYPFNDFKKENKLNSNVKGTQSVPSFKPELVNQFRQPYFAPKSSTLARALLSPSAREKTTSPSLCVQKQLSNLQEQLTKQISQNQFSFKNVNVPSYNRSADVPACSVSADKNVTTYQQEALNLGTKNSVYDQIRNVSNTISQSSQFIANKASRQVEYKSEVCTSDFPEHQYLPSATVSSGTLPMNLIQHKQRMSVQSSQQPPVAHQVSKSSTVFKTGSSYQVKTVVKQINESIHFQDNQLVHCDRSSVIQHTMQHIKESNTQIQLNETEMPNQLAVSVNSDAVEKIRSIPEKDVTNLRPFKVNVIDRTIPNSSLAVSANLVIARKPQSQVEVSQPACSGVTTVESTDTITIPGILASPSVIVSSWETQRQAHGELLYKKSTSAINTPAIDKKFYRNRLPYGRQMNFKPEPKIVGQKIATDKNNCSQVFKTVPSSNHTSTKFPIVPSVNQSKASTSQNFTAVNKSSSTVSQPVSSQPWYSEPYPKPYNNRKTTAPIDNPVVASGSDRASSSSYVSDRKSTSYSGLNITPISVYNSGCKSTSNSNLSVTSASSYDTGFKFSSKSGLTITPVSNTSSFASSSSSSVSSSSSKIPASNSSFGIVSASSGGLHHMSTSTSGSGIMSTSNHSSTMVSTSNLNSSTSSTHGSNTVPSSNRGSNILSKSSHGPNSVSTSNHGPNILSKSSRGSNIGSLSNRIPNILSKSSHGSNIVSPSNRSPNSLTTSIHSSDIASESNCDLNILATSNSKLSLASTSNHCPNIMASSNSDLSITVQNSAPSKVKLLHPIRHISDVKSLNLYSKQLLSSQIQAVLIPNVATISPYQLNKNNASNSAAKSSVLTANSPSSATTNSTITNNSSLVKENNSPSPSNLQSNSLTNIRTYSAVHKSMKRNTLEPLGQPTGKLQISTDLTADKSHDVYTVPTLTDTAFQNSHASSNTFSNSCCSPTEVNPCQNCSLPSENNVVQSSSENNASDCQPVLNPPSRKKMIIEPDTVDATTSNLKILNLKDHKFDIRKENISNCQYCSQALLETELQLHMLNCPSKELMKTSLLSEIDPSMVVQDNFCSKSLPDVVPEQDSLFHKESYINSLPHTKSLLNAVDDKNLEIDATAFNACMDLINNDNDLQRIVQGMDSFDQMGNNYLPYLPSTEAPESFLSTNLYSDIQKNVIPEASNRNIELNNYTLKQEFTEMQERNLDRVEYDKEYYASNSLQKFTDSSKPQLSHLENISPSTSKSSNELTFSEIFKETLIGDCKNDLETIQSYSKETENQLNVTKLVESPQYVEKSKFHCPHCLKKLSSAGSVKRHILKIHSDSSAKKSKNQLTNLNNVSSDVANVPDSHFLKNDNYGNGNLHDDTNSQNHALHISGKQSFETPCASEINSCVKVKSRTGNCKFCGKLLTLLYMKTHILRKHKDVINQSPALSTNNAADSVTLHPHGSTDVAYGSSVYISPDNCINVSSADFGNATTVNSVNVPAVDSVNMPPVDSVNVQAVDSVNVQPVDFVNVPPDDSVNVPPDDSVNEPPVDSVNVPPVDSVNMQPVDSVNALLADSVNMSPVNSANTSPVNTPIDSVNNPLVDSVNISHVYDPPANSGNILPPAPVVSSLLEQDFDSSTCLSVSDALKRNNSFISETSHYSQPGDKLTENTDVKFNFDALEFSRETKLHSKEVLPSKLNEPLSKNVSDFQDKELSSVAHTKQTKGPKKEKENSCSICGRSYYSSTNLNRHLKTVHKIITIKSPEKNKMVNELFAIKNMEKQHKPCIDTVSCAVVETPPNKEASVHILEEISIKKETSTVGNFISKSKDKSASVLSPSPKKSLLKAVLNSNFVKDCKETSQKEGSIRNKTISDCDIPATVRNDPILSGTPDNVASIVNKFSNPNCELQFDDKVSALIVPFENLLETRTTSSDACSHLPESSVNVHNHLLDSQNVSIQSNEISPVSEIISNVSRCQFVGISDNKKEAFEDNSLKLLIPEKNESDTHLTDEHDHLLNESSEVNDSQCITEYNNQNNGTSDKGAEDIQNNLCGELVEEKKYELEKITTEGSSNTNEIESGAYDEANRVDLDQNNTYQHNLVNKSQINLFGECQEKDKILSDCKASNGQDISYDDHTKVNDDPDNVYWKHSKVTDHHDSTGNENSKISDDYDSIYDNPEIGTSHEDIHNDHIKLIGDQEEIDNEDDSIYDDHEIGTSHEDLHNDHIKLIGDQEDIDNEDLKVNEDHNSICNEYDGEESVLDEHDSQSGSRSIAISHNHGLVQNQQKEFQIKESCIFLGEEPSAFKKVIETNSSSESNVIENESSDLESMSHNLDKSHVRCRLCDQNLDSNEILSKHLKEIHDIPVLKKHISESLSPEKISLQEIEKLSPPKLKLGTNESDSESISDLDNHITLSKTADSSEIDASNSETFSKVNACALLPQLNESNQIEGNISEKSSSCKLKIFEHVEHTEKGIESDCSNFLFMKTSSCAVSNVNCHTKAPSEKCKYRRHSVGNIYSISVEKYSLCCNSEHMNVDLKKLHKNAIKKSSSLPNLKTEYQYTANYIEYTLNNSKLLVDKNMLTRSSSEENTNFSSVTFNTEASKSLCDSSSHNSSTSWKKKPVKSSFMLQNSKNSYSKINRKKTILRSKLAGKKLIIQRLKYNNQEKIKKKRKSNLLQCRRKVKTKNTYKPIVLTLKKAEEIEQFIANHKQPQVFVRRLEETGLLKRNLKEAVVKLERIDIKPDIDLYSFRDEIPQRLSMEELGMKNISCDDSFYLDSSNENQSLVTSPICPPAKCAELSDYDASSSSDSVQFLGTVTKEKCEQKTEVCLMPVTKACRVLLKRI